MSWRKSRTSSLVPGLGAQGGDLASLAAAGRSAPDVINVSRGILYAGDGRNFAERAKDWAEKSPQHTGNEHEEFPRMKPRPTRYSGLLPHKGWPKRNFRFRRHRVVPGMFRRANGNVLEPVLAPPDSDKVRITWIGHASFFLQFAGHSVIVDLNWRSRRPGQAPAQTRTRPAWSARGGFGVSDPRPL